MLVQIFGFVLTFVAIGEPALSSIPDSERPALGSRVENLQFKDIRFLTRSLDDFRSARLIVVVATNGTCPVARRYMPILAELDRAYVQKNVQMIALHVDDSSITEMAADAVEWGIAFPIVKDAEHACVKALGLRRTPEVVVLDRDRRIRYRGRIDDQFRVGGERPAPARNFLREAIDDLLGGREVACPETPVDGCLITSLSVAEPSPPPNFAEHVAAIVQRHCQECHRPGTQAPFALISYADLATRAEMVAEVVGDRRMPPWHASSRHGEFINRRGLSDAERSTILAWARNGTPKGDSLKLPTAREFPVQRWRLGEPDLVTTTLITHEIPATGFVDYRYEFLPHVFAEDTWAQSVEIRPDNPRVLHHANLGYVKIGERPSQQNFVTGFVPGGDPMILDEGTCVLIPKGSVLGLQIHYTTTGKPERCRISVGLRFPRVPVVKRLYHQQVYTTRFSIPPFAPAHPVTARRVLDFDATGVGLFSHMHTRGKDMTFLAHDPRGTTETLLVIPNYNFDWQQSYRWAPGSQKFLKGTTFEVMAHFDNSEFNPYNPDPSAKVGHGDQTTSEMMYGFYFYTRDDERLSLRIDTKSGKVLDE